MFCVGVTASNPGGRRLGGGGEIDNIYLYIGFHYIHAHRVSSSITTFISV